MTDVPPDNGAPDAEAVPSWDPSGIRRSSYTPPPADAEPPTFDDDALADAMAAEVSNYTSEIKLPDLLSPGLSELEPDDAPASPAAAPSTTSSADDELLRALGGGSRLEAMERLQNEFHRISQGEKPSMSLPRAGDTGPAQVVSPAAAASAPAAPVPAESAPSEPVPAEPAAAEPVASGAASDDAVDPFAWLATVAAPEPAAVPVPEREPAAVPVQAPPVAAPEPAPPVAPEAEAASTPNGGASELPAPDTAPTALAPLGTEIWSLFTAPDSPPRTVAATPEPDPEPSPVPEQSAEIAAAPTAEPTPAPTPTPASTVDSAPAPDSAPASEALGWLFPSTPVPPIDEVEPLLASPTDSGAIGSDSSANPDEPVPFASLAPVNPPTASITIAPPELSAAPEWLGAAPPSYSPPELVEPPGPVEVLEDPPFDPSAPITAYSMSRLPRPLPTERPNVEDRAELPPPPGYEDIPLYANEQLAQTVTPPASGFALPAPPVMPTPPILPTPPVAPLVPIAREPLLPVPPTAAPLGDPSVAAPSEDTLPPPDFSTPTPPAEPSASLEPSGPSALAAAPRSTRDITESPALDHDDDDVIDEVDRVGGTGMIPVSVLSTTATDPGSGSSTPVASAQTLGPIPNLAPPSEPIATIRLAEGEPALVDRKPTSPSAFDIERAGLEPTPLDLRAGRAARLFWLWFAANSSVVSFGLGAVLLGTGMSLRQSIVATLAGVAISFLPLGLGTLAGKWSGQPTMIVSRATFGHAGNILPALLAVVTRVFWGGLLLWVLATAVAQVLVGSGLDAGLGTLVWQLVGLVAGFVIATVIAVFGYGFVAKLQLVLSVVSGLLIVGAAVLTYQHLDFTRALTVPDGSWGLAIGGAGIVFSVIGLAWVHSSSDLARYQRPSDSGGASMLWATFGATLPPFLLISWGAMLAASDPALASRLRSNPLSAIASLLPAWYPAPLLAAAALGLLSAAVLTIYSGGFAIQAVGLRTSRALGSVLAAVLVLAASGAILFLVPDFAAVVTSLIITLAVPVAAWAGIFAAEMMIRTRRFHTPSLLAPGGVYPRVRWLNLLGLIVTSALGFGLVTSNVVGLQWEGFLFTAIGLAPSDPFVASNIGVFVALVLGLLIPLVGGVPAIRRQEQDRIVEPPPVTGPPIVTAAPARPALTGPPLPGPSL